VLPVLGALLAAIAAIFSQPDSSSTVSNLSVDSLAVLSSNFSRFWSDNQWRPALLMSFLTGIAATFLSVFFTALIIAWSFTSPVWSKLIRWLPVMLAVPHAALAIGVVLWVAPSGWLLRFISPALTGFEAPPPWSTTQDPLGLGLVVSLVLKEVPFLLWAAASQLQRDDVGPRLGREFLLAQSMGYQRYKAWWLVVWPQLWPRLTGPVFAVLAYSLTVVDIAQIIGPQTPPTMALLTWQWLLDADPLLNQQGAMAAWMLAIVVATSTVALHLSTRNGASAFKKLRRNSLGRRGSNQLDLFVNRLPFFALITTAYGLIMAAVWISSFMGPWPFPKVQPDVWTTQAWEQVFTSAATIVGTFSLGICSAVLALIWSLAWLECAPRSLDRMMRQWLYLPLALPGVLWIIGLHRLSVLAHLDGLWFGVLIAHVLAALPYVLISLSPAYLGFDERYRHVAATLGYKQWTFLLRIKWPLLKASLLASFAVGFSVSIAQYLSTLFIGAGRFNTVTTEAVVLSSGGARSVLAAYAALQWLLPALIFAVAAFAGRPRFKPPSLN
jgi:putative thiamine transport system permease protein